MKFLVLGYFGYLDNQLDGQTIKTRNVYELLKSKESEIGIVRYFDTQQFQKSKFSIFKLINEIFLCKKLIYLPAHNNLQYLFPVIYFICKFKKIDIYYIVVGGWLADFLKYKKLHVSLLKKIKVVFPETELLKNNLVSQYEFKNVLKFPNFRIHSFVPAFNDNLKIFKIVFMARINRMKGLDTIFNLAEYLEKHHFEDRHIEIDFYGPIDKDDEEYFSSKLKTYSNANYKGILEPNNIYNTLEQYDVLVLPTKYYTEGFPGSILDAFTSGIPVVVTNWKHASEFVSHNSTGFIIPFENGEKDFIEAILKLYTDKELLKSMKYQAYEKSKEYSFTGAWEKIYPYLD